MQVLGIGGEKILGLEIDECNLLDVQRLSYWIGKQR